MVHGPMKTAVAGISRRTARNTREGGHGPHDTRRNSNVAAGANHIQSLTALSRRALVITLTDDNAMAAAAIWGDSSQPNTG